MIPAPTSSRPLPAPRRDRGSVLVVVMWLVFGLISITLYFANSMTYELRAADNRIASYEAQQAIEAGRRYATCILSNLNQPGLMPDPQCYLHEAVPVGNGKFWYIGHTNVQYVNSSNVTFGLRDEAAKMNLNALPGGFDTASTNLTLLFNRLNQQQIYNIMAWESTNTVNNVGAAESQTYLMQTPPYLCKNAPYETVDELRLVFQMNIDILYGEDANLNGALDPNEDDGDASAPSDNADGRLDSGLFEWFTVYTVESTNDTNGNARVNVTSGGGTNLTALLETNFSSSRAQQIEQQLGLTSTTTTGGGGRNTGGTGGGNSSSKTFAGPLDLFMQSGMTIPEFSLIEPSLRGQNIKGLVNVNSATIEVLQCLPGMTLGKAQQLAAYRTANQNNVGYGNTVAWVAQALDYQTITNIAPWITGRSYQYTADIAAVGHDGKGYRRTRFVFDTSQGFPVIVYRQDLTHLGWALGQKARRDLFAKK